MNLLQLRASVGSTLLLLTLTRPSWGQDRAPEVPPAGPTGILQPGAHQTEWTKADPRRPLATVGADAEGFAMRGFGARGGTFLSTTSDGPGAMISIHEYADAVLRVGLWSAKYQDELWFGYDGVRATYNLAFTGSLGIAIPFGRGHGPVVRAFARGELFELGGVHLEQLTLPGAELGYSLVRGSFQVEAVGRLGPALAGEVRSVDGHWDLAGLFGGGSLALRWQALSLTLDGSLTDAPAQIAGARVSSHVCGLLGGHPPRPTRSTRGKFAPVRTGAYARDFSAAICADISSLTAFGPEAAHNPLVSLTSMGLSLLFGNFSRLDPLE